jgi:uncharacterized protein
MPIDLSRLTAGELPALRENAQRPGDAGRAMEEVSPTNCGWAEIVRAKLLKLRVLCRRFEVRRLDLFGSAATGRFDPARSDLDFLVDFDEASRGGFYGGYFGLLEGLEALFQRRVDLLTEASLENPYRRRIEAEKLKRQSDGFLRADRMGGSQRDDAAVLDPIRV